VSRRKRAVLIGISLIGTALLVWLDRDFVAPRRPDLLTPGERQAVERLSIWSRLHRALARPLTQLRRRALRQLQNEADTSVAGSSAK